jgi:hypothetical protein
MRATGVKGWQEEIHASTVRFTASRSGTQIAPPLVICKRGMAIGKFRMCIVSVPRVCLWEAHTRRCLSSTAPLILRTACFFGLPSILQRIRARGFVSKGKSGDHQLDPLRGGPLPSPITIVGTDFSEFYAFPMANFPCPSFRWSTTESIATSSGSNSWPSATLNHRVVGSTPTRPTKFKGSRCSGTVKVSVPHSKKDSAAMNSRRLILERRNASPDSGRSTLQTLAACPFWAHTSQPAPLDAKLLQCQRREAEP